MGGVVTLDDNLLSEYQEKMAKEVRLESRSCKCNTHSDVVSLKM